MVNKFIRAKIDRVLLCLIVLLIISVAGAFLEGTSSLTGIGLIYLGVAILGTILTRRWRRVKYFLILTGASIVVFGICVLLYNAIHGLFEHWFGSDFWVTTVTGDEFLFFSIAVFVCPVGFIIGAVGSISLSIKKAMHTGKATGHTLPDKLTPLP